MLKQGRYGVDRGDTPYNPIPAGQQKTLENAVGGWRKFYEDAGYTGDANPCNHKDVKDTLAVLKVVMGERAGTKGLRDNGHMAYSDLGVAIHIYYSKTDRTCEGHDAGVMHSERPDYTIRQCVRSRAAVAPLAGAGGPTP